MFKIWLLALAFCFTLNMQSQEDYAVSKINPLLLFGANGVVRSHSEVITIKDLDKVVVETNKVITVLNEKGNRYVRAYEVYNASDKLKNQEAVIYDKNGNKIKKYKSRDFKDGSNFPSFVLFADNRVSRLDYTPLSYPYTVHYTSVVEGVSTIFLPEWRPQPGYNVSVEQSSFQIINETQSPLRYLESNMDSLNLEKESDGRSLNYKTQNLPVMQYEVLSPDYSELAPRLITVLEDFELEGVAGTAQNWQEFGKWQYDNLVKDHDDLPEETISKITALVKDASSMEEKAKLIYDYVQNKTRYIAIALGIGGWEPAYASEVDQLGYGDCKGLTNYTKALLESQGITAYYTVVHSGEKVDINPDFTKIQGNHVILNIPREENEDIWLECTSQYSPFNYLGDFTDDRYVLKVTPEGGEVIKTKTYSAEENQEKITCNIAVEDGGGFTANFKRESTGVPYGAIFPIARQTEKIQKQYYLEEWSHLQNVSFDAINFNNNKDSIRFTENIDFHGDRFVVKAGKHMLLPLNFISTNSLKVPKDEHRKYPIKMERGKSYAYTFKFLIPEGYEVEALPDAKQITSEFGESSFKVEQEENEEGLQLVVKRTLKIKKGEWSPDRYQDFKKFIGTIDEINNQKAVIVEKS